QCRHRLPRTDTTAPHDGTFEGVRVKQEARGELDSSTADELADPCGGNHPSAARNRVYDLSLETELASEVREHSYIAGVLMSESKVFADQHRSGTQPFHKQTANELLGRKLRE